MMASGANSVARLNFQASGISVNYYANCTAIDDTNANDPLPGGGCYVKLPLSLTALFIATSEKEDIKMTARVTNGSTLEESQTINVAWANVGLSGGLYYWSVVSGVTMCPNSISTPGTYCRLDPRRTEERDPLLGTAIYRYDLQHGHAGADHHVDGRRRPQGHQPVQRGAAGDRQRDRRRDTASAVTRSPTTASTWR